MSKIAIFSFLALALCGVVISPANSQVVYYEVAGDFMDDYPTSRNSDSYADTVRHTWQITLSR